MDISTKRHNFGGLQVTVSDGGASLSEFFTKGEAGRNDLAAQMIDAAFELVCPDTTDMTTFSRIVSQYVDLKEEEE